MEEAWQQPSVWVGWRMLRCKKKTSDLQSLRAKVTPTGVSPTVDHTALAASVARAVLAAQTASRTERLDSRAFSMFDKFRSERTRWHDWTLERER